MRKLPARCGAAIVFVASTFAASVSYAGQPGFAVVSDSPPKSKFSTELYSRLSVDGHVASAEAAGKGLTALGHDGGAATFAADSFTTGGDLELLCKLADRLLGDYTIVVHRAAGKIPTARLVVVRRAPCTLLIDKEIAAPGGDVRVARTISDEIVKLVAANPIEEVKSVETDEETTEPKTPAPPKVEEVKPAEPSKQVEEPKPIEPVIAYEPAANGPSVFAFEFGPRVTLRDFSYSDLLSKNLFEFGSRAPILSLRLAIELTPFAKAKHAGRFFGIGADASYSLGGDADTNAGASGSPAGQLKATFATYNVFAFVRVPVSNSISLGGRLGYGGTSFTFEVPDNETRLAPSATYSLLRIGPNIGALVGKVSLRAEIDYLQVLDPGTAGNRFNFISSRGLELMVGGGYNITNHVQIFGMLTGSVFNTAFDPKPPLVATAARDYFGTFDLGMRYQF